MQAHHLGFFNYILPWELDVEVLHEASVSITTQEMVSTRHNRGEIYSSGAASGVQPGVTGAKWWVLTTVAFWGAQY